MPQAQLWRYATALAPLAGSLTSREARAAHTAAFDALGRLLPSLQRSARLLSGLNAMSATEVRYLLQPSSPILSACCSMPALSLLSWFSIVAVTLSLCRIKERLGEPAHMTHTLLPMAFH